MPRPLPKKFAPIPEGSNVYRLEEFDDLCEDGTLTDDDGYGQYAVPPRMYAKEVYPSDTPLDKRFTHVVWFNK